MAARQWNPCGMNNAIVSLGPGHVLASADAPVTGTLLPGALPASAAFGAVGAAPGTPPAAATDAARTSEAPPHPTPHFARPW
jgi:hypothetical protein